MNNNEPRISSLGGGPRIYGLSINGSWTQNREETRNKVEDFYINLYKEDQSFRLLLDGMEFGRFSCSEKNMLERLFSGEEMWNVISGMKGDMAFVPDGFTLFL